MTKRSFLEFFRWSAVAALSVSCLWHGIDSAMAYLGSSDAYAYIADWRAAARLAPRGAAALLCDDASRISPVERSRLIAIAWERAPDPLLALDASGDMRSVGCVLSSRWISPSAAAKLRDGGFSVAAVGEYVKTWVRDGIGPDPSRRCMADVSVLRELVASLAVLTLMLFAFARLSGTRGLDGGAVAAAVSVAALLGAVALSHPLLAPNGLGTYGGKAKLLFACGGLPEAFLKSAGGAVLQPSYPPGLTALALLHFVLSGGCGDRLVQLVVVFAMALLCLGLARKAASPWGALPAVLYCLSPTAVRLTSGFYAEPLAALSLLLGWDMIGRGRLFAGALAMGAAGLFRPEAGAVAAAFVGFASMREFGFRRSLPAIALSVAPSAGWLAVGRALGYGQLSDWDFGAAPNFGQVAYAAWSEAKALALSALPVAVVAWLVRPRRIPTGNLAASLVPAALLFLAIPLGCGFYATHSASWMIDNTVMRIAWYVSVIPLAEFLCHKEDEL